MKKQQENIQKILKTLPKLPGVYQMKNHNGDVIYVGKAKNLKSRVYSYFDRTNDLTPAKRQMVQKIEDIQITITQNEVEALVFETNLIKYLRPKYNILMKDDKNLAYIKITNSPIPELIKTRQKVRDGGEYFGPYASGAELAVRTLRRIFRIRNCRMKFAQKSSSLVITDHAGRKPPCMDYYIGLCPAPCLLDESNIKKYGNNIEKVREFLRGKSQTVFSQIEKEMNGFSQNLEFEKAQESKTILEALRGLYERQRVVDIPGKNLDIIIIYEKYDKSYIGMTQVRNGQVIGVFRHEAQNILHNSGDDILLSFLALQYASIGEENEDFPDTLILRHDICDPAIIDILHKKGISIEIPKSGSKQELLDFTQNQVREYAYKTELSSLENTTLSREHMVHILEKLGYSGLTKGEIIFECYDISHTHGHFTVASRVILINGKPHTDKYKKYNIKTLEYDGKIDDFASHREVAYRRTLEALEQKNIPNLLIIDGGKGQLSSVLSGMQEALWKYSQEYPDESIPDITDFPVCSIAKREEEVFLPGKKEPVIFEKGTPELMLLQKARDESHRFAITANKSYRMKSMKKNILEEIPGIGPVTRKKLLLAAGSIDHIRNLPQDILRKICTKKQIEALKDHGIL